MRRCTNILTKPGFLLRSLFWTALSYILYQLYLFRPMGGLSYGASRALLVVFLLFFVGLGIINAWEKHRDYMRIFVFETTAFGLYTVLAYRNNFPGVLITLGVVAGVLCAAQAAIRLSAKIKRPRFRRRIIRERLRQTLWGSRVITSVLMYALIVTLIAGSVFSGSLMPKKVKAVVAQQNDVYTIDRQMDTILKLDEEVWSHLSTRERLDVLQVIANIENQHLGLSTKLNVVLAAEAESLIASYQDKRHNITISVDYLDKQSAFESVNSICHEARHAYQHRLIDVMHEMGEEGRDLLVFKEAAQFEQEFNHYITGDQDPDGYFNQRCETDARAYGSQRAGEYRDALIRNGPYGCYLQNSEKEANV